MSGMVFTPSSPGGLFGFVGLAGLPGWPAVFEGSISRHERQQVLSCRFELIAIHPEGADHEYAEIVARRSGVRIEGFDQERHAELDGGLDLPGVEAAGVAHFDGSAQEEGV